MFHSPPRPALLADLHYIHPEDEETPFPHPNNAMRDPNGLLAVGGNLSPLRLLTAYRQGIFPWYSDDQPILWWSPDPRMVYFPQKLHIGRSLRKTLRKQPFRITLDTDFAAVIRACAAPRVNQDGHVQEGTWITKDIMQAYEALHHLGFAHSVEAWEGDDLVGGLYGIGLGKVFFGESMFSRRTDASKIAFVTFAAQLRAWGFALIDGQVESTHLNRMGFTDIPREQFLDILNGHCDHTTQVGQWRLDIGLDDVLAKSADRGST